MRKFLLATVAVCGLPMIASAAVYMGNGAIGFGGSIGNATLDITDDGTNVTFTLNNASGFSGNDLVLYIDSVPGGFADTSQFMDDGDGGRTAVSGYNSGNPSQTVASFPVGFGADYALEFENDTYDGLFGLVAGGNNSLNYITGTSPSNVGGPYTITFPLADLGITSGDSFSFVGSLISTSAYRSNETFGTSVTTPDPTNPGSAPNAGFNGTQVFATDYTYPVPEPASLGLIGGLMLSFLRRSRRD